MTHKEEGMSGGVVGKAWASRPALVRLSGLSALIAAGVVLAAGWSEARAEHGRRRESVNIPLATSSIVDGEGLRTTITNFGSRPLSVQAVLINAEGEVVKQESVAIAPNHSESVEIARSEVGRSETSVIVRTEVVARRADLDALLMTTEVVDWSTGGTKFLGGKGCAPWLCGSGGNHNETLVLDREEER
jgi:hypothetical protein